MAAKLYNLDGTTLRAMETKVGELVFPDHYSDALLIEMRHPAHGAPIPDDDDYDEGDEWPEEGEVEDNLLYESVVTTMATYGKRYSLG